MFRKINELFWSGMVLLGAVLSSLLAAIFFGMVCMGIGRLLGALPYGGWVIVGMAALVAVTYLRNVYGDFSLKMKLLREQRDREAQAFSRETNNNA